MKMTLKIASVVILMAGIAGMVSCGDNNKVVDFEPTGKPDKIIVNAPGKVIYYKDLNLWGVGYEFPLQTIDGGENYLIRKFDCDDVTLVEGMKVLISGDCYRINSSDASSMFGPVFGGTEYYNIVVTGLAPNEFNPVGEPDKVIENVQGVINLYENVHWGGIESESASGTKDIYLARKFETEKVTLVWGSNVRMSGRCYKAQMPFSVPEGTTYYYTIVTDFKYEAK